MTRAELVELRQKIFAAYQIRDGLGEFDTNSASILLCMSTLVTLIDHLLVEMKKKN